MVNLFSRGDVVMKSRLCFIIILISISLFINSILFFPNPCEANNNFIWLFNYTNSQIFKNSQNHFPSLPFVNFLKQSETNSWNCNFNLFSVPIQNKFSYKFSSYKPFKQFMNHTFCPFITHAHESYPSSSFQWHYWNPPVRKHEPKVKILSEAFEILGIKSYDSEDKTATMKKGLLMELAENMSHNLHFGTLNVTLAEKGEDILAFPPVNNEVGVNIEIWHKHNDYLLSKTKLDYILSMPWTVSIWTEGEKMIAGLRVPETSVRIFFNDAPDVEKYENKAANIRKDIEKEVIRLLREEGFVASMKMIEPIEGTQISDLEIAEIEAVLGPITAELVVPSIALTDLPEELSIEDVVIALEEGIPAFRLPDLNENGVTNSDDGTVLPAMIQDYLNGVITLSDIEQMIDDAQIFWEEGHTLQQWISAKTANLSSYKLGKVYIISACQPFYAGIALGTGGLYHQGIMPCKIGIWEEDGTVKIGLSNPEVFFNAFFRDVMPNLSEEMADLFALFPSLVYNELAAIINSVAEDLGSTISYEFH